MLKNEKYLQDIIINNVSNKVADKCLGNVEREELKKKVQDIMIKKRSYRSDLLDLED